MRPPGLSAFVRCKNEEEYIIASLLSSYRIFDEILVILNNSTDRTRELLDDLIPDHPKIRVLEYNNECSPVGVSYFERVQERPSSSVALYYNWCMAQTRFSHVCKWDGDMIALPTLEQVKSFIPSCDIVCFDGYDVLGEHTTEPEPRIFRYDPDRVRYIDWDLYEVLDHDYEIIQALEAKCYIHMKLVKKEWVHKEWFNPNLLATRSVPHSGRPSRARANLVSRLLRRLRHVLGQVGR